MAKLIYAANTSFDGYLEDETGSFHWSVADEEVHAFWNEHERHIGTALYGRRMYETMRVWESDDWLTTAPAVVREYAGIWRDADKIVYSSTLEAVSTVVTIVATDGQQVAAGDTVATNRGDEDGGRDHRAGGRFGRAARTVRHPSGRGRRPRAGAVNVLARLCRHRRRTTPDPSRLSP